jgi:cation:H+ antiporter
LLLNIVLSVAGFALLLKCADFFVDGASSFAKNFKIPTVVVGLTIVAFATSAPELAISFSSHMTGNMDILFGNVMGSNIANILVILGVAVVIVPFKIQNNVLKFEIPILLLITMGLSVMFLDDVFYSAKINSLTRADGIVLILFFSVFVYYLRTVFLNNKDKAIDEPKYNIPKSIILLAIGLVGIIFGSDLLVDNIAAFAAGVGISQKVISVTIISIGTSLPELVITVLAAKHDACIEYIAAHDIADGDTVFALLRGKDRNHQFRQRCSDRYDRDRNDFLADSHAGRECCDIVDKQIAAENNAG